MYFAHLFEQCANFKSPSMQIYRNKSVETLIEKLTEVFCSISPPEPSGLYESDDDNGYGYSSNTGGSVNFSSLMDRDNGCISGICKIKMESGEYKRVDTLKKHDKVFGGAEVVCVIKMNYRGSLIKVNNKLVITPFHPILYEDKWVFPIDLVLCNNDALLIDYKDDIYVYNIVLNKHHIIEFDQNLKCITLGHLKEDGILKHEYYGTQRIIDDLSKLNGWDNGFIFLQNFKVHRNPTTGNVLSNSF